MDLKWRIDQDLKSALLAREELRVSTLRGLKSAILYAEVAEGAKESGLAEDKLIAVLSKEAKKRQESADIYEKSGEPERAEKELSEKKIIAKYLPEQLSDDELEKLVDKAIAETGASDARSMGLVIGKVKTSAGGQADGARVAKIVKEKLGL
jgi:uncharacterized protein YqeY